MLIPYLRSMHSDELYMSRCIQLAKLGIGSVAPNPMVGAVILYKDKIIGEGYHQKYGEAHAEVNAINSVTDKSLLSESTIYVSLEPCSHYGKTPPCANLLLEHGFKRVVIGSLDVNSAVNGSGIQLLKNSEIEVEVGILEKECKELNKHFFTFHTQKRPYVFLKWAQTVNGLLDDNGKQARISSPEMQTLVHQMRTEHQAILVGRKTVETDNPSLTVRLVEGKNPIRIVLDSLNKITHNAKIFNGEAKTIVLNTLVDKEMNNNSFIRLDALRPEQVLAALYSRNIQSVLIEGGAETLQSFIDAGLWDEAKVITGQCKFEKGTKAPVMNSAPYKTQKFFSDTIISYRKL